MPLYCHLRHRILQWPQVCLSHWDLACVELMEMYWSPRVQGWIKWVAPNAERKVGRERNTPPALLITLGVSENVAGCNERFSWWRSDYLLSSFHLFYSLIFYCVSLFHLCDQVFHGAAHPCLIPPLPQRRGSMEETGQWNIMMTNAPTDSIW